MTIRKRVFALVLGGITSFLLSVPVLAEASAFIEIKPLENSSNILLMRKGTEEVTFQVTNKTKDALHNISYLTEMDSDMGTVSISGDPGSTLMPGQKEEVTLLYRAPDQSANVKINLKACFDGICSHGTAENQISLFTQNKVDPQADEPIKVERHHSVENLYSFENDDSPKSDFMASFQKGNIVFVNLGQQTVHNVYAVISNDMKEKGLSLDISQPESIIESCWEVKPGGTCTFPLKFSGNVSVSSVGKPAVNNFELPIKYTDSAGVDKTLSYKYKIRTFTVKQNSFLDFQLNNPHHIILPSQEASSLAVMNSTGNDNEIPIIAVGTKSGLAISSNLGDTWTTIGPSNGLYITAYAPFAGGSPTGHHQDDEPIVGVTSVKVGPSLSGTGESFYVSTPEGLYEVSKEGEVKKEMRYTGTLTSQLQVRDSAVIPAGSNKTVYLITKNGLFQGTDGASFAYSKKSDDTNFDLDSRAVAFATDGSEFYVATSGGLATKGTDGKFTLKTKAASGLQSDNLTSLAMFNGKLYIASADAGISFTTNKGNNFVILNKANSGLINDKVNRLVVTDGRLCALTDDGVSVLNSDGTKFTTASFTGLPSLNLTDFVVDPNGLSLASSLKGTVGISTNGTVINFDADSRSSGAGDTYVGLSILPGAAADKGLVALSTQKKLDIYNSKGGMKELSAAEIEKTISNPTLGAVALAKDSHGNIFSFLGVAGSSGAAVIRYSIDPTSGAPSDQRRLTHAFIGNPVRSIILTNNLLFIGSSKGLMRSSDWFTKLGSVSFDKQIYPAPSNTTDYVSSVVVDSSGNLLISGFDVGLVNYKTDGTQVGTPQLTSKNVTNAVESKDGNNVWQVIGMKDTDNKQKWLYGLKGTTPAEITDIKVFTPIAAVASSEIKNMFITLQRGNHPTNIIGQTVLSITAQNGGPTYAYNAIINNREQANTANDFWKVNQLRMDKDLIFLGERGGVYFTEHKQVTS